MTRTLVTVSAIPCALLALLAACDGPPTGWIPLNGQLSGVVTLAPNLAPTPAPPAPAPAGTPLAFTSPPREQVFALRSSPPAPETAPAHPRLADRDLIVTFRRTSPVAVAAVGTSRAVALSLRSRVAALLPGGAVVSGVSPAIFTARVRVNDLTQVTAVATILRSDPEVISVSPDRPVWLDDSRYISAGVASTSAGAAPTTPNDAYYPFQSWHYAMIDLPRAWTLTKGSTKVTVAVVDDGIRFDHPGIAANLTSDGYDFVATGDDLPLCSGGTLDNTGDGQGPDPDPTIPSSYFYTTSNCFQPGSLGAHGLHVAGTIGAVGNDGVGTTGVNATVHIRPVRVLGVGGFGRTYDIAQGILYAAGLPADDGAGGTVQAPTRADIINLSLGGSQDDTTMHRAITSASGTGVVIVVAAGNTGKNEPVYPAVYPEVISVAAVGPNGAPTSYSTSGPTVALRAPGGDFNQGGATGGVTSTMWNFATNTPDYGFAAGTSMAAPHVSGAAALLLALSPSLTPSEVRTRLTKWAVGPSTLYGVGTLNAYNSLAQRAGPDRKLYVQLFNAHTGEAGGTAETDETGAFTLTHVKDGSYFLYGGVDEDGDKVVGVPGRWWGALGDPAVPTSVLLVDEAAPKSFSVGFPLVASPYHFLETPNVLVVGGYVQGTYTDTTRIDVYKVNIPQQGSYTFETSGWLGNCGFALEEATAVGLYDATGKFMTSTGFIDSKHYNYCSRLTTTLTAGSYLVGVAGAFSNGRYRLAAKAGT